jgi:hypothetical protein
MTTRLYPMVKNSLLRCTRKDTQAHPIFKCVAKELGIWVLELAEEGDMQWPIWLESSAQTMSYHREFLTNLLVGSQDYTLHILVRYDNANQAVHFPPEFLALATSIGFTIEVMIEA